MREFGKIWENSVKNLLVVKRIVLRGKGRTIQRIDRGKINRSKYRKFAEGILRKFREKNEHLTTLDERSGISKS